MQRRAVTPVTRRHASRSGGPGRQLLFVNVGARVRRLDVNVQERADRLRGHKLLVDRLWNVVVPIDAAALVLNLEHPRRGVIADRSGRSDLRLSWFMSFRQR